VEKKDQNSNISYDFCYDLLSFWEFALHKEYWIWLQISHKLLQFFLA